MLQNLQNFAKFRKIHLDNLVDFEKCWKTRVYLQRSAPIQPKASEMLPKQALRRGVGGAAEALVQVLQLAEVAHGLADGVHAPTCRLPVRMRLER